ncbi:hemin ABC transporter substrate-binding protein [Lacibacterium aquatile]|uniref:Hemin ABC transporter substrate-binding protein n=1 Tax=Lacibacterium aquatile TaxID=1168082 RepID=A0ABW5DKC1_9PROT
MRLGKLAALALAGTVFAVPAFAQRVISLGGGVTEMVYALGAGDKLIAADSTSTFPDAANSVPKLGYVRTLGAEGVLSLTPDIILAGAEAGPPDVLQKLAASGIKLVRIPEALDIDQVPANIRIVADALGVADKGKIVSDQVSQDIGALKEMLKGAPKTKALFILSAGRGTPMAAGTHTIADTIIRMAGGENVNSAITGYKPVSAEAVLGFDPAVIVTGSHVADALGGAAGIAKLPELSGTAAAKNGRIAVLDSLYLLGLGPRTAHAVHDLAIAFGTPLPALPDRPWLSPN